MVVVEIPLPGVREGERRSPGLALGAHDDVDALDADEGHPLVERQRRSSVMSG